jgi:hypothetical protein
MHLYRLSITIRIEFDLAEIFGRRPCEFTAHSRRGPEAPLGILPNRTAVFPKMTVSFLHPESGHKLLKYRFSRTIQLLLLDTDGNYNTNRKNPFISAQ